jgi:predicted nuclease of restriction endonuclease-like (RecB) superfamily
MKNDPAVLATPDYRRFIEDLKARVTAARISAARHVNRDMILLYWDIGKAIVEKQKTLGWGDSVVEVVAADLRRAFPGARGFSANNVWLMRQFFSEYSSAEFLEQAVQEILPTVPWGHHVEIVKKVKAPAARLWYLEATARLGWSRNVLLNQIKAGAYERARTERKTHNFELALPEHLAEQAGEMLKSSYNLEFLGIRRAAAQFHRPLGNSYQKKA